MQTMDVTQHRELGRLLDEISAAGLADENMCELQLLLQNMISINDFNWRDCHAGTALLERGDFSHASDSVLRGIIFAQVHGFGLGNRGWRSFLAHPNALDLLKRFHALGVPE